MRNWDARRVAEAAGATVLADPPTTSMDRGAVSGPGAGPSGISIDSRAIRPGDLFVGLIGERADGGTFAEAALEAGAWGFLVGRAHAEQTSSRGQPAGARLVVDDPLAGLHALARAWRRELGAAGARVVAITGSTGKTSTKDILTGLLSPALPTVASPLNHNTEIGLPLAVLAAPLGTRALVLELAMRGPGQIGLLASICEPEVGVIVNVGPAHLELLGSIERVAAAKAELLDGLAPGAIAVLPADEPALEPYVREDIELIRFGPGGDVSLVRADAAGVEIDFRGERIDLEPGFRSTHQLSNLLAAVGAAAALGVRPQGRIEVAFTGGRGDRRILATGVVLVDDCYNANPMSMRAALEDLKLTASGRRVAVLGDMLELGPDERRFHRELGEQASDAGIDLLVTVGSRAAWAGERFAAEHRHADDAAEAAAVVPGLVRAGDTVLIKGSRGVGLEVVTRALAADQRAD
ncbi:MAG TPA: UDP-N-acetylmuramoyl-tripeptide--D-alanyl-D-alanine ligase [Solirubrobacteraceae bacterium]|jgi:UDP-N-acetylmuramoyl-tripeptide--D-alanyl-D-alanine ligase|nr:UDP-N-acetylmuramoyl-tripeptide--D-alanyl-D-alanine ligase [Solirubrobacteraceae bacterium]